MGERTGEKMESIPHLIWILLPSISYVWYSYMLPPILNRQYGRKLCSTAFLARVQVIYNGSFWDMYFSCIGSEDIAMRDHAEVVEYATSLGHWCMS